MLFNLPIPAPTICWDHEERAREYEQLVKSVGGTRGVMIDS
jgi:hypothetical protein